MPDSDLTLNPLTSSGEHLAPLVLTPPGPYTVGRSSEAEWTVPDQAVSRMHAMFTFLAEQWFVSDLESRHGVNVNGKKLTPGERHPIGPGDLIELGVWSCRCRSPRHQQFQTTTFEDKPRAGTQIAAVKEAQLDGLAQRRLDALLTVSREFNSATDKIEVAQAAVRAIHAATGCARVMVVAQVSSAEFSAVASTTEDAPQLSRSLIEAAKGGQLVELRDSGAGGGNQAHSILDLGIRTAICAPIMVGGSPDAFLYLDTRKSERALPEDGAAFCQSVAQQAGLANERIRNAALAARHAQLEQDLSAARRAQEMLMPPKAGEIGKVNYAYESLPGRVVAGDLFDAFALSDTRTAVFLGDVTGKGVGAAVLMAAAQSQLRARLMSNPSPSAAVAAVSHDLNKHTEVNKFVTLIVGIIDAEQQTLEIVDAGHGFAVLVGTGGEATKIETPGGFPLGVVADADYESVTIPFTPGSSLVVFSDGVIEQPNLAGEQFGYDASVDVIATADTPESISKALLDAVREHAQADLADDLTVAAARLNTD